MNAALVGLRELGRSRLWPLIALSLAAWGALFITENALGFISICFGSKSLATRALGAFAAFSEIGTFTSVVVSAALMLCAMMAPLLYLPLMHLHARSLSERRRRATLLFVAGYFTIWLLALIAIAFISSLLRGEMSAHQGSVLVMTLGIAIVWQGSGMRSHMLVRCCARPALPVFGISAEIGSLRFGVSTAGWCIAACWALMAIPFFAGQAHLPAMIGVMMIMLAQQYERPVEWASDGKLIGLGLAAVVFGTASAMA